MSETRLVIDGLGFPESTRWRDGRAWLCNWGAGEVLAVTERWQPGGDGSRGASRTCHSASIGFPTGGC